MILTAFILATIVANVVYGHVEIPLIAGASPGVFTRVELNPRWEILGPFQSGTREATWGADPLERLGGFRVIEYSPEATFKSSLAANGTVCWSWFDVAPEQLSPSLLRVDVEIAFPEVDWHFQQATYGWASLQYQGWARGIIVIKSLKEEQVELFMDGILEFMVDDKPFFGGDLYSLRRAPVIVGLSPGSHRLDIRLVRDVRAMGGAGIPKITVRLQAQILDNQISVDHHRLLLPDIVDGKLPSTLASIPIRNTGNVIITVIGVSSENGYKAALLSKSPVQILPGQTRPIAFQIFCHGICAEKAQLFVEYKAISATCSSIWSYLYEMRQRSVWDAHKFTFLHPSGVVSYAILQPPSNMLDRNGNVAKDLLPVLINLHGAGLEADNEQLVHSLDAVSDLPAWKLFPTGGSPWSSDDWHSWGWKDVEAAINAIPIWITSMNWTGAGVEVSRWFVVGHSNGGQGVWYAVTHRPDKIIAAAPISGYLSIQKYVPYILWHEAEPRKMAVLHASMSSYRHEMLISYAQGIPIFQQHGGADDNVPPYHSRRMSELLKESGWTSGYSEAQGKGHWWDGVLTTDELQRFYHVNLPEKKSRNLQDFLNNHSQVYELIVANPGDTEAKFGINVKHLSDPGQLGRVRVKMDGMSILMKTSNLQMLEFSREKWVSSLLILDNQHISFSNLDGKSLILKNTRGSWSRDVSTEPQLESRSGAQLGHMEAILKTKSSLLISYSSVDLNPIAVQISRNLFQYYGADSVLLDRHDRSFAPDSNQITISVAANVSIDELGAFPIQLSALGLTLKDHVGVLHQYFADGLGLGAIFLRPLPNERLELVIWGVDSASARFAARLVPTLTGVGQPDFVILTNECLWKGVEGVLAMGFFDSQWNITASSFLS